ncbi:hypothetical protein HDV00_004845 [Rhizophlyctis rosea]|nr:hypothetical protein HDV00_004845 [Rhizophlyctis rosea]
MCSILGHQNSDDRPYPSRIDLTSSLRHPTNPQISLTTLPDHDPVVQSLLFSKYHSVIVTKNRIYTNGFGPGGRLGLGHEETTLKPTVVKGLPGGGVRCVAVGPDHTVVVMEGGDVWTWGVNKGGQLGYATELVRSEASPELSPREVIAVKRVRVLGAAASKFHTAVFTDGGTIYSWGTNVGQLGKWSETVRTIAMIRGFPSIQHISLQTFCRNFHKKGYIQPPHTIQTIPKKITSFPQQNLLSISATHTSTAILTTTHEVHLFSSNTHTRIHFPPPPPSPFPSLHSSTKTAHTTQIVAGHHIYAAVDSEGDVFLFAPSVKGFENEWQQRVFGKAKRVWTGRGRSGSKCVSVGVGIDGGLLVGTESGGGWRGVRRREPKRRPEIGETAYYKFTTVPYLQHVKGVSASSAGAFGIVRSDVRPGALAPLPSSFLEDIGATWAGDVEEGEEVEGRKGGVEGGDAEFVCRDGGRVRAYSAILSARSVAFRRLFSGAGGASTSEDFGVRTNVTEAGGVEYVVDAAKWGVETIELVLEILYTARYTPPWDHSVLLSSSRSQHRALYLEFTSLMKSLDLDIGKLTDATTFRGDFRRLFESVCVYGDGGGGGNVGADVVLRLSDRDVECHSVILASRSDFFSAMLGVDARWTLTHTPDGKILISLPHFSWDAFSVILKYLYGVDVSMECLRDVRAGTVEEYVESLMEVISVADEMLCEGVKRCCEGVLVGMLDVGNVVGVVDVAEGFGCEGLLEAGMDFLCQNLSTALETYSLTDLSPALLPLLESHLKSLQRRNLAYVRSEEERIKLAAREEEERQKEIRRREYEEGRKAGSLEMGSSLEKRFGGSLGGKGVGFLGSSVESREEWEVGGREVEVDVEGDGDSAEEKEASVGMKGGKAKGEDDGEMFEMEIEDVGGVVPSPSKKDGRKGWAKMHLGQEEEESDMGGGRANLGKGGGEDMGLGSPSEAVMVTKPPVAPWRGVEKPASRLSLRDIMLETQEKGKPSARPRGPSTAGLLDPASLPMSAVDGGRRVSSGAVGSVGVGGVAGSPVKNAWPSLSGTSPTPNARRLSSAPKGPSLDNPPPTSSPSNAPPTPSASRTPTTAPASTPSPKKLSQKDRKKLKFADSPAPAPSPTSAPTTPGSPWAKVSVPAFNIATGNTAVANQPRTSTLATSLRQPSSPFSSPTPAQQQPIQPNLAQIQREQEHYQKAREKMMKKSLGRIQVEEEAKREIGKFYLLTRGRGTGEWVVVEGV